MKKLAFLLIAVLSICTAIADDYKPMVREGVKWVYAIRYRDATQSTNIAFITYEFKDDVVMNDKTYKKCWRTVRDKAGELMLDTEPKVVAYAREQDKKVYAIYNEEFIAQNRDYNAGYYEYDISELDIAKMMITIQGIEELYLTMENSNFYPDYTDEYLIYDFNDLPNFYEHYPEKVYHCRPWPLFSEVAEVEIPNSIITEKHSAKVVDTITLHDGRDVNVYNVKRDFIGQVDKTKSQAPAIDNTPPSIYEGDGRLAIDGYGIITFQSNRLRQAAGMNPRSIAACINRSFISPDAMLRHIDESPLLNPPYPLSFCFCHIEDNGEKVVEYKLCDYYHKIDSGTTRRPSTGIDEVEPEQISEKADGLYYDMQGRSVTNPAEAGIYIHNRKKVIVR